ncbi:deoxyribose-phosphate aldolase [Cohnella sp. CFH 77786]|uniref:deoxyribose-phosphate aldolase n=1 Tax=Cohnella sp. CFH 77786 TaxID=2662265 RepID=UPI001C60CB57|nr:deoxyribose-phosphate aldolase [Cohnella sp. CFH 77786]MBW5445075.1 deoxyribose-phosphate aldolase [Cohnella sp. CFH 77786]
MKPEQIAKMIDHTLLSAVSTKDDILRICGEARKYGFATVCVNPYWIPVAVQALAGSGVGVATVVGFPLGASRTEIKAAEAKDAVEAGATEIDMVLNVGALKSGDREAALRDVRAVVEACRGKAAVKVIIETCYLTDEEKREASLICKEAGADFVKTSTGFGTGGATVADIELIRAVVGPEMGIKASGGVRGLDFAEKLIEAGATRLGASASVAIVTGGKGEGY